MMRLSTISFASIMLVSATAAAQPSSATPPGTVIEKTDAPARRHSVNVSPIGLLTGSYNVNYEHLFDGGHGLIVEGAYNRYSDADTSSVGVGANVGYRWHWRGQQNSGFVGATAGYSIAAAEASRDGMAPIDLDAKVFAVTANIGKRWAWDSGLNITFRLGAGYGNYDVSTDSTDPDDQELVQAVDDLLHFLPIAFEGELSLGYTF